MPPTSVISSTAPFDVDRVHLKGETAGAGGAESGQEQEHAHGGEHPGDRRRGIDSSESLAQLPPTGLS